MELFPLRQNLFDLVFLSFKLKAKTENTSFPRHRLKTYFPIKLFNYFLNNN